ncbi:MAG TPA: L,D-transpeptidase family protein [Paracoccaceae bacterium]|nr:L,D-transpeptidase family protein [Paracoccaceae bacterium]
MTRGGATNRNEPERGPPARRHDLVVGPWGARFLGRRFPCSTGRGGIVAGAAKAEGDLGTPTGAHRLLWLYWRADRLARPATVLAARPLGPAQGWSEAPQDPAYNCPIRHPHGFAADRMARGDGLYDICAVTDQNRDPVVPGAGSAIFVHLWRKPRHPTAGCVAFRRPDLEWILARWTPQSRLVVRPRGGL